MRVELYLHKIPKLILICGVNHCVIFINLFYVIHTLYIIKINTSTILLLLLLIPYILFIYL
jgi:hypothetical protein